MDSDKRAKNLLLGYICKNCAYARDWVGSGALTCDCKESNVVSPEDTCCRWTHERDWAPMTAAEIMERER